MSQQPQSPTRKHSYKIKQFEWYQVQTKVRQLMVEILQPFNKKQTQQTIKINEIKRTIAVITKKQQQHSFLLEQQDVEKPKYLQIQDQKLEDINNKLHELNLKIQSRVSHMEKTIGIYQDKINQLNQLENKLDDEIKKRKKQFQQYRKDMNQKTDIAFSKIQTQSDQINTIRTTMRNSLSKIQMKSIVQQNRLKQVQNQLKRKVSFIDKLAEQFIKINQKIRKLQNVTLDLDTRLSLNKQNDTSFSQKILAIVQKVRSDFDFLHGYMEKYQPLYIQMQISEILNIFLQGKARRLVCIFEQQKFAQFHNDILQNTYTTLQEKMTEFSKNIRQITNRNRKYLINLKVIKTLKINQNVYETRQFNQQLEKQQQKKNLNIIIPSADITKIVQQKWANLMPQLKIQITQEIKPTKIWMQELQQQFLIRTVKTHQKLEQFQRKLQTQRTDFELHKIHTQSQQKQYNKKIQVNSKLYKPIVEFIKQVISFGSVINHIVIQDQIDRQGLALYALKGGNISDTQKVDPTIQLDSKCLACTSGNPHIVNQAFKMACLSYNPSEIKIDNQTFSRQQILQVSTNILQKLKQKIDNLNANLLIQQKLIPQKKIRLNQRRSQSQFSKEGNTTVVNTSKTIETRSKQLQTMLPILGSSRKGKKKNGDNQYSIY